MDEMSHSGVYSFDANLMTIQRHATSLFPARRIQLGSEARNHLAIIRDGLVHRNRANPHGTESAIAAWQDVLAVYFAHWEE